MAQLVDQYGNPIDFGRLKEEQAGPTTTGVRQILSGHPAQGLTPRRLTALLRQAEDGDATSYLELAEEMEEKDLHYLSVISTRKRAVSQLEITVEAASDDANDVANADLVREWLRREALEDEMFDILDAIGKGFSVTEIMWETSEREWQPRCLEWRDPRWFEFDRDNGKTILLRDLTGPVPLAPFKFIQHQVRAKSGLAIRGGLARAAAWSYLFKNYDIKDWVTFVEVHGQPIRVGKYHPGATETEKDTLLRAVANIGSDAAAIIPESMLIEFVESGGKQASAEVYERLAEFLDKQVSKAVLGQTLTTEVGSVGSFAASQTHDGVRKDIMRSDARQLASVLNRDLIRPYIDLNRGPQKKYPRVVIGLAETVDMKVFSDAIAPLIDRGLRVEQSVVRDKFGIPDPGDGEDLELLRPANTAQTPQPPAPLDTALQSSQQQRPADSIDDLVDTSLDGWERLMKPLIDPIKKLLEGAASLEEVQDRLANVIGEMDTGLFSTLLARAGFAVHIAGKVEAPIAGD